MQTNTVQAPETREAWVFVSDKDIVPEDDQNRLIYWRDVFLMAEFAVGDIANKLCDQSAERGLPVTQQRIFDACGGFCGRSGRTVRYYAETARFYPEEIRQEFSILPFSHFTMARYMGERWREVLEYAVEHPSISEEGLRRKFSSGATPIEEAAGSFRESPAGARDFTPAQLEEANKLCEVLEWRDKLSENAKAGSMLAALSGILEKSEIILREVKLRDETARNFTRLLIELRDVVAEIALELRCSGMV